MNTPATISIENARQLEQLLGSLHAAHADLLSLTAEHRAAISRADTESIAECARRHADLIARIGELESMRRRLIIGLGSGTETSISSLADRLPEAFRARILAAAAALRDLLLRVQREVRALRSASHALVQHMDGLMQQVAKALSHSGTYSPRGRVATGAPVASGLDLTH